MEKHEKNERIILNLYPTLNQPILLKENMFNINRLHSLLRWLNMLIMESNSIQHYFKKRLEIWN